jgi:hypothetical protein
VSAGLGYQWKFISRLHLENIDPDKEHHFVFGGTYEFFRTIQSRKTKAEDRVILEGTDGFRPSAGFLVRDMNRVELRWINGVYSTTYRNRLTVERDFLLCGDSVNPIWPILITYLATPWVNQLPHPGRSEALRRP